MKFYGIDCQGDFLIETVSTLPTFDENNDYRRLVYNESDNKTYYGKSDKWSILGSGIGEPVTNFTSGGTIETSKIYLIDTTSSSKSGTLTNSNLNDADLVSILDVGDNFNTNSFTVNAGSGDTINGFASFTCSIDGGYYQFIYNSDDSDWKVVKSNDISTFSIKELSNVSSASPSDDDVLQYNIATGKYEPVNMGGGTSDDEVYGLIRYQPSAPTAGDEKVYIDSDDDTLYVYDDATSTWKSVSGGTGSATVSGADFTALVDDFSFDTIDVNVSRGSAFDIVETIDFGSGSDGSVWYTFHLEDKMNSSKDLNLNMIYNLSGSDDSKVIDINTSYWSYGNEETPSLSSPTATNSDSISSDTTQGKRRTKSLTSISASDISDADTITIRIKRRGGSDTYSGTLQMLYLYIYQN